MLWLFVGPTGVYLLDFFALVFSQEVSPFPAGDHKAQRHSKHKTEKNIKDPQKKYRLGTVRKNILLEGLNQFHGANLTPISDVDQDA